MKSSFFFCLVFLSFYSARAQDALPAEHQLSSPYFFTEIGIYALDAPLNFDLLKAGFIKRFPDLILQASPSDTITENAFSIFNYNQAQKDYPAFDLQYLQYYAKGLSDRQRQMLAKSNQAIALVIYGLKADTWKLNKSLTEWIAEVSKNKDWIIYDQETREYFTAEDWTSQRLPSWTSTIPYIANQITIHSYREEAFCRSITLGMQKFGLPDIVINNASCYNTDQLNSIINILAQHIATQPVIYKSQVLLDINKIQDKILRKQIFGSLQAKAKKKAILQVKKGLWEEGDPFNALLEIDFSNKNYESPQVCQEQLIADLFGTENKLSYIQHNEAILEASQEAKAKLPELQALFNSKKMAEGYTLLLKAPFDTDDGKTEWMWMEVTQWATSTINGLLQNEPFNIKKLKVGSTVSASQEDIFDYILHLPDGTSEGNKTGDLILKAEG